MRYYEVDIADAKYRGDNALTYHYDGELNSAVPVSVTLKGRVVSGFIKRSVPKPGFNTLPIKQVLSKNPLPQNLIKLAGWLSEYYGCSYGEALRLIGPTRPIQRKSPKEYVDKRGQAFELEIQPKLNEQQQTAIKKINSGSGTSLLHGITGSGKTEVYMSLAEQTTKAGQSVIFLTPEIALTPQFAAYAQKRLNIPIYVVHSHLTAAERKKLWIQILEHESPVAVIGPRSALFLPVNNLGLIVVDEAHETAYKQQNAPRYHAVRAASQLGKLTGAKVVLGTATPDLVDYYLAREKSQLIEMNTLAKGEQNTQIEIVDMTDKTAFSKHGFLSDQLLATLNETLANKRQALIYLNRRGTARLIMCSSCGWKMTCDRCNQPLVYHGDTHQAICHGCGLIRKPPTSCPTCNSEEVIYKNIGTKAIAEALSGLYKNHRVVRFDSDNKTEDRIETLYPGVLSGEVDIIVGTQLIAKGLDLPKLGMVGVVIADTALFLPDFRADERTYQLLQQVIGRVGRGHGEGKVVVQAYNPDNPAIKAAVAGNWEQYAEHELIGRKTFRYPPFTYLLKLVCRRTTLAGAQKASSKLANELKKISC